MKHLIPLFLLLLTACAAAPAEVSPTPTALPPAPALERPAYAVERGVVERALNITGRVTPVDLERLSFRAGGRVAEVRVRRGDAVRAGDLLAELVHDEALEELARAEARVAQAERDLARAELRREREVAQARLDLGDAGRGLEEARAARAERVAAAELALRRAEEDLARLSGDSPESLVAQAERDLERAGLKARADADAASEAKTRAEHALIEASEALERAQAAYSAAYWDLDWVTRYNTHPREQIPDPATGEKSHRPLEPGEREGFEQAFDEAERALHAAERALPLARREVELARERELQAVADGERAVADAQRLLDLLRSGQGSAALAQARRQVEDARVGLEQARRAGVAREEAALARARLGLQSSEQSDLDAERTALDDARLALAAARRRVDAGRVVAPRDGAVLAVGVGAGDTVEAYAPVVELADPTRLELAAELSAEQLRELAEGMPAEARLAARPDLPLPATIRRLPAPYGSGGSGAVAEQDRGARFSLAVAAPDGFAPGAVARIRIVIERREGALWLPPEAIRSFEGRRFVVVREGGRERRAPVRLGVETPDRVEILDGLREGDVVVGP